jgi:hypothetical protein
MKIPLHILKAMPACAEDISDKYALGSIKLERDSNAAIAITTDGRRILVATWGDPGGAVDLLLPVEVVNRVSPKELKKDPRSLKTFADVDEDAQSITVHDRQCETKAAFVSEGKFPQWRDVIPPPEQLGTTIHVNGKLLYEIIRAVMAIAKDDYQHKVALRISADSRMLEVSANSNDSGDKAWSLLMALGPTDGGIPPWVPEKAVAEAASKE